jgi:transcriptional regulator with XRE-family HTH domain
MVQYLTTANRCRRCWYNGKTVALITAPRADIPIRGPESPISPSGAGEGVDFAEALRYWRRIRRMTAVQVGIRMGARGQRTQIRRWEKKLGTPIPESIMRVAGALGIPAVWLLAPWPIDETSRAILREASALPAAARQVLIERVRAMVIAAELRRSA